MRLSRFLPRPPADRPRHPRRAEGWVTACGTVLLLGLFCPVATAQENRPTPREVDRFVERHLERTGLPGATVAITKDDEVVHTAGYGHDSNGDPLTAEAPMRIASLSKSFTALSVMQLVDSGEVELDRPVRDYVPQFRLAEERGAEITVRQLLNQTSGMSDSTFPDASRPEQPDSLKESVAQLRDADLTAAPGSEWNYHNPNYHVAARLVETVSGTPFPRYLDREVFTPAGMDSTRERGATKPDIPEGHIRAYGMNIPMPEPRHFSSGSGGIVSTADDMARWLILQNNAGEAANDERVVSADAVEKMHTPSADDGRYALGWMKRESDAGDQAHSTQVWHGGAISTHSSYQFLVPETGYGIAVLFNSGIARNEADTWALADGLLALTEGREPGRHESSLWKIDAVFGALTVATAALGARGVLRRRAWAANRLCRPRWRIPLRLLPYLVPPVLLAVFQPAVDFLMGGRDATWAQRFYAVPAELTFLGVAALACLAVLAARLATLARQRPSFGGFINPPRRAGSAGAAST